MGYLERWNRSNELTKLKPDDPGAFELARSRLEDDDRQTRLIAIKTIGRLDPIAAKNDLNRLAASDEIWQRRIALEVLRKTSGREFWPRLIQAYEDPDNSVALDAFRGLEALAGAGDVGELMLLKARVSTKRARRLESLVRRLT